MEAPEYVPFLFVLIAIFNVFGQFGNINIIILYIRKPNWRSHYGILLFILSTCQSFCLLSEMININWALNSYNSNKALYRDECFHQIFPYVFFNFFQADVVAAISIDFLLCLCFPLRYRTFHRFSYLATLLALPVFHGLYLIFSGFRYTDHSPITLCNPPSSLVPEVTRVNYAVCLVSGSITIASYSIGFTVLFLKSRARVRVNIERKALRSISLLVIIFLFNRYIGILLVNILNFLEASHDIVVATQDLLIVFALVCFSQNFYVCYFRSSEYRTMFNAQMTPLIRLIRPNQCLSIPIVDNNPSAVMSESNKNCLQEKRRSRIAVATVKELNLNQLKL